MLFARLLLILLLAADASAQSFSSERWFPPAQREAQKQLEAALNQVPSAASLRAYHDLLGSEPHLAGTPGDHRTIDRMVKAFEELGLEVQKHEFWAYLTTPVSARLEIIETPTDATATGERRLPLDLKERAEDEQTRHPDLTIGFNAYSGSGDVTAEVVYANYGTKADFEKLRQLGIDCTGKIVIARYGGNFRGYKAKFAEAAGAVGLIIYTDPADSGYMQGVPYPEGGFANDTHIQRGSLITLDYVGDPLTPGHAATKDAERLNAKQVDLPTIPVQPIGYGAAREIMTRMIGTALPRDLVKTWQGGLPCAYRLQGGRGLKLHLAVEQKGQVMRTANVTATLRGSDAPEQEVIIGCHHDAWGFGAADPLAGTILVFEAAKSFAAAAKQGHRPARSIVFATWGAEEYGIIGSTEYCEQHQDDLAANAVAYINLDMAAMGPNFGSSSSPTLKQIIEEVTHDVPQTRASTPGMSVHQAWLAGKPEPAFGTLGGGSDHVGFYCHLGIPSCSLGGEGSAGTSYHSNYDHLAWYRKVVGDDYEPALMLTRAVNLLAARLGGAALLPLEPARYATDAKVHLAALATRAKELNVQVDFSELIVSIERHRAAHAARLEGLHAAMAAGEIEPSELRSINLALLRLERQWLAPSGSTADGGSLAGLRPWYRNLFASSDPDSGYSAWMLPGLRHAIEQSDAAAVAKAQAVYEGIFDDLERSMQVIDEILGTPVE